jgi:tetrahydromethanopterin S-methyltransferase subunit C
MARTGERGAMTEGQAGVGAGWVIFAGTVMIIGGFFAFFEGLAAVLKGNNFYAKVSNYPFGDNVKTWGWIVLIAGIIVLLAGIYVMMGALWARIVGITLASLSAFANFFFIPFYPVWALMVITLDIFVIWALAAHGKALVES